MGTRGPAPIRPGVEASGKPRVPAGMPAATAKIFRRLVATLPQVTAADEPLLAQLAQALALQGSAYQVLCAEGVVTADKAHGGEPRRHAAMLAWKQATEVVRACAARLGGSPLDRQRLIADPDPLADNLATLLYGEPSNDR